ARTNAIMDWRDLEDLLDLKEGSLEAGKPPPQNLHDRLGTFAGLAAPGGELFREAGANRTHPVFDENENETPLGTNGTQGTTEPPSSFFEWSQRYLQRVQLAAVEPPFWVRLRNAIQDQVIDTGTAILLPDSPVPALKMVSLYSKLLNNDVIDAFG